MSGVKTWIVSREDLILSKLVWAKDSKSELQIRDIIDLIDGPVRPPLFAGLGCEAWSHYRARRNVGRMNDTSPKIEALVNERYKRMTPDERVRIAASMFETARAIVLSSLPPDLSRRDRRLEAGTSLLRRRTSRGPRSSPIAEWPWRAAQFVA